MSGGSFFRFGPHFPKVAETSFIAPGALVIGNVSIQEDASVWYGAVVRGDVAPIRIGRNTNIQDGTVIHVSRDRPEGTVIGADVTVGHLALIHACTIEDECLIGMKACVMDGAVIERGSWIGAGALVTPGKRVRAGEMWTGVPAKLIRQLTPEESETIRHSAALYVDNARSHRASQT